MRWFGSLRSRVLLLVTLIMLPALGALWVVSEAHYVEARRGAEARLVQHAAAVAGEYERLLIASRRLLLAVTESTWLALDHQDDCDYQLTAFARYYELLHGLHVVDADGTVWCADASDRESLPDVGSVVADARGQTRFASGGIRLTDDGMPLLPVALPFPVRDLTAGATANRTLAAAIDLRRFPERSGQPLIEPDAVLAVFDDDGVMIARYPDANGFVGRQVLSVLEVLGAEGGSNLFINTGLDGVERLFANVPMRAAGYPELTLIISTGLPTATVYAGARRAQLLGLVVFVITALAVTLVTMFVTRRFMLTDLKPLIDLTDRVAAGDVPESPPAYSGPAEFRELRDAIISSARAQRESESALQFALRRLDTYFRNSPMAFIELDAEFKVRTWTPQAERVFGWEAHEVVGKTPIEVGVVHPDDADGVGHMLERVFESGGYVVNHNRNLTRGGKTIWCEWHNSVLRGADGRMMSMLCIALDETERVVAAQELQRREARYRLLFAENPAPMWVFDRTTLRFIAVNRAAVDAYGWTEDEFRRMTIRDIRPPSELEQLDAHLATRDRGVHRMGIWRHLTKDGTVRSVEVTSTDMIWDGHAARFVVAHDVTGRERAKADLEALTADLEKRVAERTTELEYVNRELEAFAYTVSHDLRAPLRSIDGFSHLLVEDLGSALPAEAVGYLERIGAASQRMGMLIDDLLALSRVNRGDIERRTVDLSALAAEVADEVRTGQPRDGVVELSIAPGMVVRADPGLLRVVLANLIGNACKFTAGRDPAKIEIGVVQGEYGPVYHVRDNGVGFDMRYSDKLFGVFERLHGQDEFAGTGIGLATVQRIMHRHGGRVWAEGRPGEGATFWIRFPEGERD